MAKVNFHGFLDLMITDGGNSFPKDITVDELFGSIVKVIDKTKTIRYIADGVYESDGKLYFTLGTSQFYYNKTDGNIYFV